MAQALFTAIVIGFIGLVATAIYGLAGIDISRHIRFGIFSAMLLLLAHSMMMFYLIGKGKAVKDALTEGGYPVGDPRYKTFVARISLARKPVFSIGTLAMIVTMIAAIMGAGVDTGTLPPMIHAMMAYGGIACNLAAIRGRNRCDPRIQPRRGRGQSPAARLVSPPVLELSARQQGLSRAAAAASSSS